VAWIRGIDSGRRLRIPIRLWVTVNLILSVQGIVGAIRVIASVLNSKPSEFITLAIAGYTFVGCVVVIVLCGYYIVDTGSRILSGDP